MVPTDGGGHVRSFSITPNDLPEISIRSNERYDVLIDVFQLQKQLKDLWPKAKKSRKLPVDKDNEKGVVGVCILRELSYFDVGRSFMADSLHNVYIGAFVSKE